MRALSFFLAAAILFVCGAALAQQLTIYSNGNVAIGQTRQLTAYVPISPNTLIWSVNGISGGDPNVGTVSDGGLFRAPSKVPMSPVVKVRATSTTDAAKFGEVAITITQPPVQLWSISPSSVPVGPFTIRVNGANMNSDAVVYASGTALVTKYNSSTSATAQGTAGAAQAGKQITIHVQNPGLGGTKSSTVLLQVTSADSPAPANEPPPAAGLTLSPSSVSLALSATQQFTTGPSGSGAPAISYAVNGIPGGDSAVGTMSTAGLYTAPAQMPAANTVTIRATSGNAEASATVTLQGPPNAGTGKGTANLAAGRFLEQAAFGPTPSELARVQQIGVNAWLDEQFNMPETIISGPDGVTSGAVQQQFLNRLTAAPDQLRQPVLFTLSQIIVISMNKNLYPNEIVPYLQILSKGAFGNYRTLLGDITVSAGMGKYLDLAKSAKPVPGSGANENYAREMLQLFTIGLVKLNPDGTSQLDAQGKSIPTYEQAEIQRVALALTGWVYPDNKWEDFSGPMVPNEANHDTRQKSFLSCTLPAGQTTTQDMNATLDCAFNHPNVGPFIATRLIRNLVTSNPTPAYVGRVAAVFADNGTGVRGDLRAVVKSILTVPEARNDAGTPVSGRVKDAIYHVAAFVRAFGGYIAANNGLPWQFSQMAQTPLMPPSVFGFYSPLYRMPKSTLSGPELQIYTPTEAALRGNMFWQIISSPGGDFTIDYTNLNVASVDTVKLIDAIDQTLLYGRMPQAMRQTLANVIAAQGGNAAKMQAALYLAALSGLYTTQY